MQLETLSCNNCGAPISVPESANYATCAHCGSRLAVKRTDTAHYTEVIEQLAQRTSKIDEQVHRLQIENELLRLDQDWEQSRQDYMIRTKDGGLVEPTQWRAIGGAIAAVFVVLMTCGVLLPSSSSVDDGTAGLSFLVLLIGGGFALYAAVDGFMKYQAYKEAEESYYQARSNIESRRYRGPDKLT